MLLKPLTIAALLFALNVSAQDTVHIATFKIHKKDTIPPYYGSMSYTNMNRVPDYLWCAGVDYPKFNGYVALTAGPGIPVKGFADYAKTGWGVNISAGMPIRESSLGIAAEVGYNYNNLNTTAFSTNSDNNIHINNATGYRGISTLGGLFLAFPTERLSFQFRIFATFGPLFLTIPNATSNRTLFVYDAGFIAQHDFRRRLSLFIKGSFLSNILAKTYPSSSTMPYEVVNASFGLGYKLKSSKSWRYYQGGPRFL